MREQIHFVPMEQIGGNRIVQPKELPKRNISIRGVVEVFTGGYSPMQIRRAVLDRLHPKEQFNAQGILHGEQAFVGPDEVHIDLTNMCPNKCIGCWCRSPLLEELTMGEDVVRMSLPMPMVRRLIRDLAKLRCKSIKLIGGGEPFYYPHIMEVVRLIKKSGIDCKINTAVNLINPKQAIELVDLGVDLMDLSVWASNPEIYELTHLETPGKVFHKVAKTILAINEYKRKIGRKNPQTRVYNVILSHNYKDIIPQIELAIRLKADMVQFNFLDPIPGKTEHLLLNEEQRLELCLILEQVRMRLVKDLGGENQLYVSNTGRIKVHAFNMFYRRAQERGVSTGEYDKGISRCFVGWLFCRVMANGDVIPCLKSHRIPIGNLFTHPFPKIWNDQKAKEFRQMGRSIWKNQDYFKQVGNDPKRVGCWLTCDNVWQNELAEGWVKGKI